MVELHHIDVEKSPLAKGGNYTVISVAVEVDEPCEVYLALDGKQYATDHIYSPETITLRRGTSTIDWDWGDTAEVVATRSGSEVYRSDITARLEHAARYRRSTHVQEHGSVKDKIDDLHNRLRLKEDAP